MKKINSIGYGGRVLGAALVLLIPVPCVCLLLARLTSLRRA